MARKSRYAYEGPQPLKHFRTHYGTPNALAHADHEKPGPAKKWLRDRMQKCPAPQLQMIPIIDALDKLVFSTARSGSEWDWRAYDAATDIQYVFRIEIL